MVPKTFKIVIIGLLIAIGMPNVVYGETDTTKWALTRISVAHVRVKPGHASELSSQTLMGMPVKLLEKKGDWWHVETHEGYKGYIIDNSLTIKTPNEMHNWRASNRVTLTVTVDDFTGRTRVHTVGSGGGEGAFFRFDWGASASFAGLPQKALADFLC